MDKLAIGTRKTVQKVLYGISKLFVNFNKKIKGVRKSKTVYPIIGDKENNFQVCFPVCNNENIAFPVVFYFHGGGWMEYDKCYYHTFCKRIAKMGAVVCNVNYSLVPKSSLDEIIQNCIRLIIKAKDYLEYNYSIDKNKIFLAGDSAGAHISALIAGFTSSGRLEKVYPEFKNEDLTIAGTLLFYGVYDLESVLTSGFPSVEFFIRNAMKKDYLVKDEMEKFSPMSYITPNFPKTFIASGEIDKLHESQSVKFYDKLIENRVEVQKYFFDKATGMGRHGFVAFDDFKSNALVRDEIKKYLKDVVEEQ